MSILTFPARRIALVLVFALLNQAFFPAISYALTSGPTQPEASSFTPAGHSDMVDIFSGDFQYNIPLMDVGGYPLNIAYSAGVGMDEEASWVGLGWNLNPGLINRQMRGIPDDFKGDSLYKAYNIKPDVTLGVNVGGGAEIVGTNLKFSASRGLYHNTYRGWGVSFGISPSLSIAKDSKTPMSVGLGLKYDSQGGLELSPNIGLSLKTSMQNHKLSASTGINSRSGLRDLSISYNVKVKEESTDDFDEMDGNTIGGNISFAKSTYTPISALPMKYSSFTFHGTVGFEVTGLNPFIFLEGYRTEQSLGRRSQRQAAYGYLNSQLAREYDIKDFNRERNGLPWRAHMPVLPPAIGTNDLLQLRDKVPMVSLGQ